MLEAANAFSKHYASLIDAMMMVATVATVAIALYSVRQALREKQLHIVFRCELSTIFMPSAIAGETALYVPKHQSVTASLTNRGFIATSVPYLAFGLMLPRGQARALLNPATDYRINAPLSLPPGRRISIELRSPEQLVGEIISIRPKFLPRWRCRCFRITFATETDDVFRAEISRDLRKFVQKGVSHLPRFYDSSGGRSHEELQAAEADKWANGSSQT